MGPLFLSRRASMTICRAVRVRLEFLHLGNKKYCFEKLIYIHLCNSRNGHAYRVAAPLLGDEVIFGQLLHDAVGGHAGFIHLVYSDDYVNSGCLCVVDSSMVCGMIPSSAATTRTAISVACAPRALIEVNAAWPGVSRKVIF